MTMILTKLPIENEQNHRTKSKITRTEYAGSIRWLLLWYNVPNGMAKPQRGRPSKRLKACRRGAWRSPRRERLLKQINVKEL